MFRQFLTDLKTLFFSLYPIDAQEMPCHLSCVKTRIPLGSCGKRHLTMNGWLTDRVFWSVSTKIYRDLAFQHNFEDPWLLSQLKSLETFVEGQ